MKCLLCDTTVTKAQGSKRVYVQGYNDDGTPNAEERYVHNECGLREVLGGIGHLTDHAHWCIEMHDPDGGLSYRKSALAVVEWVKEHGVEAAAEIQP
jgi:hypothetical protein